MSKSVWREQFPDKEYEVPALIEERLFDMSYHNDVCPSFIVDTELVNAQYDSPVTLWVDCPEKESRELPGARKYTITHGEKELWSSETATPEEVVAKMIELTQTLG